MTPAEISRAAQALFEAEKSHKQIGLLTRPHPGMTMDDAYAVQKALVKLKIADGRRVIGWKIGLTSKAMQYALNIDIPDSGILFDDMYFEDGTTLITNGTLLDEKRTLADQGFDATGAVMVAVLGSSKTVYRDVNSHTGNTITYDPITITYYEKHQKYYLECKKD